MSNVIDLKPSMEKARVDRIWYTRCPLPAASGIAQRQRWIHREFARSDIEADTIRTSTERWVRDSHFTHAHPNLFREGGPVPPIWAKAQGQDTALIGISRTDEARAVLVRADSSAQTLSDLPGLRLGLPRHATQHVDHARAHSLHGFLRVLAEARLERSDVRFADVAEQEYEIQEPPVAVGQTEFPVLDALVEGRVDAVYVRGGRIGKFLDRYRLRALPAAPNDRDGGIRFASGTPRAITVNRKLALERPDIVARYLALLLRAAAWASSNPDEAVSIASAETGASIDGIRAGFGPRLTRQLHPSLSPEHVEALRSEKVFLLENGFLAGDFDFDAWIDPRPLEMANASPDIALPLSA